jgi:dTDP-4-dehydrorhamnose reductase
VQAARGGATGVKVLVTGAGGMLARSVVRALEKAGHEVLPLRREDSDVTALDGLRHPAKIFGPDWILNCAAYTKVDECEQFPDRAHLVNGLGARNAAMIAAELGAAVLSISTDYVFDGRSREPYREYDTAAPQSVYGASKWAGEQAIRETHARHIVVRTAWLYGHGGANFIDTILRRARAGEPLRVVDDQRGSPTWTHDLSDALLRLMTLAEYGTYHFTSAGDCTWHELATYALRQAGVGAEVERIDSKTLARPAPRPQYSVLSTQWFEHVTGMRPPHWQDAVNRYLAAGHAAAR